MHSTERFISLSGLLLSRRPQRHFSAASGSGRGGIPWHFATQSTPTRNMREDDRTGHSPFQSECSAGMTFLAQRLRREKQASESFSQASGWIVQIHFGYTQSIFRPVTDLGPIPVPSAKSISDVSCLWQTPGIRWRHRQVC